MVLRTVIFGTIIYGTQGEQQSPTRQNFSIYRDCEASGLFLTFLAQCEVVRIISNGLGDMDNLDPRVRKSKYLEMTRLIRWCGGVQEVAYGMMQDKKECHVCPGDCT